MHTDNALNSSSTCCPCCSPAIFAWSSFPNSPSHLRTLGSLGLSKTTGLPGTGVLYAGRDRGLPCQSPGEAPGVSWTSSVLHMRTSRELFRIVEWNSQFPGRRVSALRSNNHGWTSSQNMRYSNEVLLWNRVENKTTLWQCPPNSFLYETLRNIPCFHHFHSILYLFGR